MLERVQPQNLGNNFKLITFRDIEPDSMGEGIAYVRNGIHKFTKTDKPFITLFLQDVEGAVIPAYIFDVDNFRAAGLELTKVIHGLVKVRYKENYLPKYGLTLILDKVEFISDPPASLLATYIGSAQEAKDKYEKLSKGLSKALGLQVTIPFTICSVFNGEYGQGEIGGLAIHYWDVFQALQIYAAKFSEQEQKQLWSTFALFLYAHHNFLRADDAGEADISLVTQLTAMIQQYMHKLPVGDGAVEIVHVLFGYEPKDIFVRLIMQVSRNIVQATKEISLYKTLPDSREGNAGYGTIRRYPSKV